VGINRHTIKLYWEQVKKYKVSFFVMLAFIPIASLFINSLLPYFFSQIIGQLVNQHNENIITSLVIAGTIGLVGVVLNFIGFQAMVHHEAHVTTLLRYVTFRSLINKDLRFFVNEKIGSMTSKYIDFVRSHIILQDLLIIRTLGFVLSLSTGIVLIALQSWLIASIILILLVGLVIEVKWSLKKRDPYRQKRKTLRSEIHGRIADGLTNSLIIKTFGGEKRELEEVKKLGKEFEIAYKKDIGFVSAEGSVRILLMVMTQITAISISAWLVTSGDINITTVVFSLTYLQLVGSQIFTIGDLLNGYEEALLEAAPMSEMLMQQSVVKDTPGATILSDQSPAIKFDHVSYRYDDSDENVLDDVDITIQAGQKVGLIGHSGAGKTTITHLLLRFSDVSAGTISIGGSDIREVTQDSLRSKIAYVPQEPMLFHRTLKENVAYGRPEASDDEIHLATRQANAIDFIDKLPQQFDTIVGERGVKLSGGQRQRIAIARAILKDAPILVLDEATSALDSESEKLIQEALEKLMKGRTSIVIAHRLSTIAKLDRIIVLDDGKIVEDGTHTELLERKGIYASLWSHQSGGFIEE
jgi:ATP-binding cassette subfamily B protein